MNEMKPNQTKCHLMVAEIDHKNYSSKSFIYLDGAFLESEDLVTLLGVNVDKKLKFDEHMKVILSEANKKLNSLMRVSKFTVIAASKICLFPSGFRAYQTHTNSISFWRQTVIALPSDWSSC